MSRYAMRCMTGGYYKRRWQAASPEVLRITGQNYKNVFYQDDRYKHMYSSGRCNLPKGYFRKLYEPISKLEAIILTKGAINETKE